MHDALSSLLANPAARRVVILLSAALFALFGVFDLRSGGMERNFALTNLADPAWSLETFGPLWVFGGLVLNLVLAVGSAVLITMALTRARDRRAATVCSTSAVAPLAIGFTAFTCPGCVLPVAGLVGASVMGTSLPLLGLEFKALAAVFVVGGLVWAGRQQRAATEAPETETVA